MNPEVPMSPTTLEQLAISPTGFVFDPSAGSTYTVNATGRVILEAVRDGKSLAEIVAEISDVFDLDGQDLRRDVLEFVRLLRQNQLVPSSFELEAS